MIKYKQLHHLMISSPRQRAFSRAASHYAKRIRYPAVQVWATSCICRYRKSSTDSKGKKFNSTYFDSIYSIYAIFYLLLFFIKPTYQRFIIRLSIFIFVLLKCIYYRKTFIWLSVASTHDFSPKKEVNYSIRNISNSNRWFLYNLKIWPILIVL